MDNNKSMNLLKTVFISLIIITFVEIIYYLFFLDSKKLMFGLSNKADNIFQEATGIENAPNSSPAADQPAIHPDVLERMRNYKYDENSRMSVKTEFQTVIKDMAPKGRESADIFYPYALKIVAASGKEFWMYFPDFLFDKTKVFIKTGTDVKAIEVSDLHIGDKVTLIETYDPHFSPDDPQQLLSYEIYKTE